MFCLHVVASPETGAKGFHWEIIAIGNQCNRFEFPCILSRNHKLVRTSPSLGIRFIENQSSNRNCPNFLEEAALTSTNHHSLLQKHQSSSNPLSYQISKPRSRLQNLEKRIKKF
ncbi:hypothetical protein AVEN_198738-1 [Araneus ventricosus]|uniref:Uncharacterized protein n=1 Tax=Araneus ventricosus TaxID=182803 RepID=A0A4Y2TKK4_ARAVE|nr:hypothetical protein AVEN_171683-1 [Araneus ventricosus]GBO00772.1 hypothetical protein AVEN_198738-1 [Araneus ventricosus]